MIYNINNFFNKEECANIINLCEQVGVFFNYMDDSTWDCKRIYDNELKEFVLDRFNKKYQNNDLNLWFDFKSFEIKDVNISLTKYYDNRRLDLHLDASSQFTTVIVLSDDFVGGEFILSNTKKQKQKELSLKKGEGISFDGSTIYHGVNPVTSGIRIALNIWMTNTEYKYRDVSKKTLL